MKRAFLVCLTSLVSACAAGSSPAVWGTGSGSSTSAATAPEVEALARELATKLGAGAFDEVAAQFNSGMARAMSSADLSAAWHAQVRRLGPFRGVAEVRISGSRERRVAVVLCELGQAHLELRLVLDEDGRVGQLALRPSQAPPHPSPPYADRSRVEEVEVTVGQDRWKLPGTLSRPRDAQRCPALVLVHGSGPNDRDNTVGPNKPFRDLALGLASRGVCVLRYEKRSRQHAKATAARHDLMTVEEETVEDALRAVTLLRDRPEVDPQRIFVLGHSLGGTAIPRIARRDQQLDEPRIAGFVILAGSTLPLEDSIERQLRYVAALDGHTSEQERELLAHLATQVARVKSLTPNAQAAADELPLGIPAAYWLDLAAHPPVLEIARERRPVFVLHGERDYQVTEEDFEGWRRALGDNPHARFRRYPRLNHLFLVGAGKSSPPEYLRPGHVAVEVVDDVAAFILDPTAELPPR